MFVRIGFPLQSQPPVRQCSRELSSPITRDVDRFGTDNSLEEAFRQNRDYYLKLLEELMRAFLKIICRDTGNLRLVLTAMLQSAPANDPLTQSCGRALACTIGAINLGEGLESAQEANQTAQEQFLSEMQQHDPPLATVIKNELDALDIEGEDLSDPVGHLLEFVQGRLVRRELADIRFTTNIVALMFAKLLIKFEQVERRHLIEPA